MLKQAVTIVLVLLIASCATSSVNGLQILNRDGNVVRGTAGTGWTDDKLKSDPLGVICKGVGEIISDISITRSDYGGARFIATCDEGESTVTTGEV